ncbi:MAG: hypothetical protein CVU22_23760 [Betaproteobacteria bacterium HGW-Betaproteobacteria-16]|nr:MAG: hypothetical protein CVU22_23760 [Betaproteobacteria bacterium HGW-Betaproteobacteria-16]
MVTTRNWRRNRRRQAHPRRATRDPLKGAIPEARQSRFLGISGLRHFAPARGWCTSAALCATPSRGRYQWPGRAGSTVLWTEALRA